MLRGWTELLSPAPSRSWLGWHQSWGHRRWRLFWVGERPRQIVGEWERETFLTTRPPEPPQPAQGLGVPTGGCLTPHKSSASPWSSGHLLPCSCFISTFPYSTCRGFLPQWILHLKANDRTVIILVSLYRAWSVGGGRGEGYKHTSLE